MSIYANIDLIDIFYKNIKVDNCNLDNYLQLNFLNKISDSLNFNLNDFICIYSNRHKF